MKRLRRPRTGKGEYGGRERQMAHRGTHLHGNQLYDSPTRLDKPVRASSSGRGGMEGGVSVYHLAKDIDHRSGGNGRKRQWAVATEGRH